MIKSNGRDTHSIWWGNKFLFIWIGITSTATLAIQVFQIMKG